MVPTRASWKKFWVQTHNYLGFVLSLFFLLLFGSGIVMLFVGYPRYYETHRLADLPPLDSSALEVSLREAYRASGLNEPPEAVRVYTLQGRPVYRFQASDGSYRVVFGDNGKRLVKPDPESAHRTVEWFMRVNGLRGDIQSLGRMSDVDPWTTNPGFSGTPHWPFYKFDLGDPAGTQLYVSSQTAEVVHRTTFWQRFWGYLGPVIHYFYVPTNLRQLPDLWYNVVVFVSGFGSILCGLGLVIGIMFVRWGQLLRWLTTVLPVETSFSTKPVSPYSGWLAWHNYLGLVFGFLTLTWIFSGMMSMNPLEWHEYPTPTDSERARWARGPLRLEAVNHSPARAAAACRREVEVREIRLRQLGGTPYYICLQSPRKTRLVMNADDPSPRRRFSPDELRSHVPRLMPDHTVTQVRWLKDYDSYYHLDRSVRLGDKVKRLPVVRAKFDDPDASWFYIDPHRGRLLSHYRTKSRLNRWLFDGLHTLDFAWLYEKRRPLWWTVMFVFLLGGLALSVTSVWLTARWVRSTLRTD